MLKRHPKKLIALAALIGAAFYLFWPGLPVGNRNACNALSCDALVVEEIGADSGAGNVVGIEPFMHSLDYATPARFQARLEELFQNANERGWFNGKTIVLLPEHLGTWLMAVDQGSRVYDANSTADAMLPIITHNLIEYLKNYFIFDDPDNSTAALIRTRTRASADAQMQVYSNLAKKYGVTLVAGSSALMTPGAYPDSLSYGHGPIFNAGFVFGPDGKPMVDAVRKVHPIPSETGFTRASQPDFLPTFDVAGRTLGVLICADSWFDDTTGYLADAGVDLLLVPSFLESTPWDTPWGGYLNDTPAGDDSWRTDVGQITEGEAWVKYALPARAGKHGIRWGMNVFLKGELWGMTGHGRALILADGDLYIGSGDSNTPGIYNLWLK